MFGTAVVVVTDCVASLCQSATLRCPYLLYYTQTDHLIIIFFISCFRYLYLHCEESSCKCLCENVLLNLASPLGTSSRHHLWIYYGVLLNKDASFLLLFVFEWQMSKIPTRCFRWLILWSGLAGRAQDANSTILPGIQIMLLPMICPPPRWRAELGTDKKTFCICVCVGNTHIFFCLSRCWKTFRRTWKSIFDNWVVSAKSLVVDKLPANVCCLLSHGSC